jgi:hypothetical protein
MKTHQTNVTKIPGNIHLGSMRINTALENLGIYLYPSWRLAILVLQHLVNETTFQIAAITECEYWEKFKSLHIKCNITKLSF